MSAALDLAREIPERTICAAAGVSRSTLRRRLHGVADRQSPVIRPTSRLALSERERAAVLAVMHSDRFADRAPATIHATLLDEGIYLCSVSTMYRLLRANAEVPERRRIARHPEYRKPELVATAPRQVLSWDITKLRGPHKGEWFSLARAEPPRRPLTPLGCLQQYPARPHRRKLVCRSARHLPCRAPKRRRGTPPRPLALPPIPGPEQMPRLTGWQWEPPESEEPGT